MQGSTAHSCMYEAVFESAQDSTQTYLCADVPPGPNLFHPSMHPHLNRYTTPPIPPATTRTPILRRAKKLESDTSTYPHIHYRQTNGQTDRQIEKDRQRKTHRGKAETDRQRKDRRDRERQSDGESDTETDRQTDMSQIPACCDLGLPAPERPGRQTLKLPQGRPKGNPKPWPGAT